MNLIALSEGIQIPLTNTPLYEEAMTHKSYANENPGVAHNERLEFLGDAVLEVVVTEFLFEQFPLEPEGILTKYRSALVSGQSLARIAKTLSLGSYLRLSRGERNAGGQNKDPLLADVFEALVGALHLDVGQKTTQEFIQTHVISHITEVVKHDLHLDAKSAFQEYAQEKWDITPVYEVISESGPDHRKKFLLHILVEDRVMGKGSGTSKKKAEIVAATDALQRQKSEQERGMKKR